MGVMSCLGGGLLFLRVFSSFALSQLGCDYLISYINHRQYYLRVGGEWESGKT